MNLRWVIYHYKTTGNGTWEESPTTITDAYDVSCNQSLGDMNDIFSFKINNIRDSYQTEVNANTRASRFRSQDKISLYYVINNAALSDSTNLVFTGLIKKVGETESDKSKVLRIEGISFSEFATKGLAFTDQSNVNVMTYIAALVQSVKLFNDKFGIDTSLLPTKKYNQTTGLYNGDDFPVLNGGGRVSDFYRSLSSSLDKYLTNEYTGDGRYYWYIDTNRYLRVGKRSVGANTFNLTRGVDFKQAKYDIDSNDVKNYVIVKCGYDPANNPITTKTGDYASIAKNGFKYYMLIDHNIAGNLLVEQGFAENTRYPASYPYTVTWKDPDTGSAISVSTPEEFTEKFRLEAKRRGITKGNDFISLKANGLLKVSIDLAPTTSFRVGDKVGITDPGYGLSNYAMRVTQVDYSNEGVQLVLEEEVAVAQ